MCFIIDIDIISLLACLPTRHIIDGMVTLLIYYYLRDFG